MRNQVKLIAGDCLAGVKTLPDASVHCVVTSPPYWGLRDYGVDGQIGLETSFDAWLDVMVALFGEIRRVLHPSGTLWVNMGDSYNSARARGSYGDQSKHGYSDHGMTRATLKMHAKNRLLQPARLALALQSDGWILRDEIIWHKTNAMPSSIDDRTTPSHEFIHLFARKPRYFFDSHAIKEKAISDHPSGNGYKRDERLTFKDADGAARGNEKPRQIAELRNKRSVWTIPARPFAEAHFATFPPDLPEECIKAGTSEKGCCPKCLAPWVRLFETEKQKIDNGKRKRADAPGAEVSESSVFRWEPSCNCEPVGEPIPCTVLDPFSGAGTTGLVAARLQRSYVGIELNPEYLEMSRRRIADDQPLFNEVTIA